MSVTCEDVVYAAPAGENLLARVYQGTTGGTGHAVVSIHGGAWTKHDRTTAVLLDRSLAESGMTVIALDFRQGPHHKHPEASRDIAAGIRFARIHADRWGYDPDSIGVVGSSSGGQLTLLAGLTPSAPCHQGTTLVTKNGELELSDDVSCQTRYVVALWPVSDPLARLRYAESMGREDLVASHFAYFSDETCMAETSIPRILEANEADSLPPIWVAQPGADRNVPPKMTLALLEAYQRQGGMVEYAFDAEQPHAFLYEDTPETRSCLAGIKSFISRALKIEA